MKDNNNKMSFEFLIFATDSVNAEVELIDEVNFCEVENVKEAVEYFEEDFQGKIIKGSVLYSDSFKDIAIFKVEENDNIYVMLGLENSITENEIDNLVLDYIAN